MLRGAQRRGNPFSPKPPLCKGRWYGEAVPEGLLPGWPEGDNPSVSASRCQLPLHKGALQRYRAVRADRVVRPYNGTSYPKGTCSASLHGRTASPTTNNAAPPEQRGAALSVYAIAEHRRRRVIFTACYKREPRGSSTRRWGTDVITQLRCNRFRFCRYCR